MYSAHFELLDNATLSKFLITKCAKYLGVTFDNSLSFDLHINNSAKNLSSLIGILAKQKLCLNTKALLNLFCDIFHLHLQYGFITWNSTIKTYKKT